MSLRGDPCLEMTAAVGTVYFGTGETIASTEVLTCTFAYEAAS